MAVEAAPQTDPGTVVFFTTEGRFEGQVTVGALPDAVTFSPDGRYAVVANEGEPSDDYTVDPEGSVSVIDLSMGISQAAVRTADFTAYNTAVLDPSIRIFGPGASVAQDLEPEYVAISPDGTTAYVTIQENNALATVDLATATVTALRGLGFKDHSLAANGFDASNRDDAIAIQPWPVLGLYQPDAIAAFAIEGTTYLVTANEGDARDYDGYSEEARIKDLTLDPTAFPNAATLQDDANLGRLKTTTAHGDTDGDGDYDVLYSYGARSFSVLRADGSLLYDSGDDFEQITARLLPDGFNSTNDENDSFDNRSDDKGPEPEGITTGVVNGRTYAFIGLERVGGVMVYDVTNPSAPTYVTYVTDRLFGGDAEAGTAGGLGPEGIVFISAQDSPTGQPLLVISNEVSGSLSVFGVQAGSSLTLFHNNDGESALLSNEDGFGGIAAFASRLGTLRDQADTDATLFVSSGDNFLAGPEFSAGLEDGVFYDALALGALGYDAIALGNHDFDFGPDVLADFIRAVGGDVPFLSANLDFEREPELEALETAGRLARSVVIEKDGQRFGLIGATTPNLRFISSPRNVEVLTAVRQRVQGEIDRLEAAGIDKIILISHLQGLGEDRELVSRLRGVDIAVAGGGDDLLANEDDVLLPGDTPAGAYPLLVQAADGAQVPVVTTSGSYEYIGRLIVEFDAQGVLTQISDESGPIRVVGPDSGVADAVPNDPTLFETVTTPVAQALEAQATTVVATTEVRLTAERSEVRRRETAYGNVIADALLSAGRAFADDFGYAAPQIALQNGGGIRNDVVIEAGGTISVLETFRTLPFGNFVSVIEDVSPQQLQILLESAYSRTRAAETSGTGRFAQVAGLVLTVDTTAQALVFGDDGAVTTRGRRVRRAVLADGTVLIDAAEVQPNTPAISVATIDFLVGGGDQYAFGDGTFTRLPLSYQAALQRYLETDLGGTVTAAQYGTLGRIGFVSDSQVANEESSQPGAFALAGLYPNPAAGEAHVAFSLPASAQVSVQVFDVLGRRVAEVPASAYGAGRQSAALGVGGLPSGVYVVRVAAELAEGMQHHTARLTVVR